MAEVIVRPQYRFNMVFTGLADVDSYDFVRKYEKYAHLNGWRDELTVAHFELHLRTPALNWYTQLETKTITWTELRQLFLDAFPFKLNASNHGRNLFTKRQLDDESLIAHYWSMEKLYYRLNSEMREEEFIEIVISSMNNENRMMAATLP